MKIQTSVKITGLICIVLGISGIAWYISHLELAHSVYIPDKYFPEIPPSYLLSWNVRLTYIGIIVNAFYLTAGILFFMKKHFSIKVMYSALVIMILYKIIPLILLNPTGDLPHHLRYEFNFENFISPIFNIVLLIIVYRIGRNYFIPPEEDTESSRDKPKQIGFLISGYILLILSSTFLGWEIITLIAMPAFLISIGIILIYYLSLISKENQKRRLAISLIISGILLLSAVVGYSSVKFMEYIVDLQRDMFFEFLLSLWPAIGIYFLASLIILIGIRQSSILNKRKQYLVWLPTLVILPLVMMLIVVL